jgi:FecR-like protein
MKLTKTLMAIGVAGALTWAGPLYAVNKVAQLAGTLAVQRADGSVRILSQNSEVNQGDTLTTERDSYAQVKMSDGGLVTMKPNTRVKLDDYNFSDGQPEKDSMAYSLLKGGLRFVSGLIGKRGNKDAYALRTSTATIGIRGTAGGADDCTDEKNPCVNPDSKQTLPAGVYVNVTEGEIVVTNSAGSENFSSGQFGLIALNKRPISIPEQNAVPPFVAPPQFGGTAGGSQECVVK